MSDMAESNSTPNSSDIELSSENPIEVLLFNSCHYVDQKLWWELIQEEPKPYVKGNSKKMKVVKGTESYEDLYKLGRDMFNLYQKDKGVFTMPKNKSRTIECIVLEITNRRVRVNKGDIHKVMTESNKIFIDELTKKQSSVYILEQKDILRWVLGKWSTHSFENQVKIVDNDRLRVFGLMFSESTREYIPNLIGGNRLSITRAQLDEQPSLSRGLWQGRIRAGYAPKKSGAT